jgi:hypothetical protein
VLILREQRDRQIGDRPSEPLQHRRLERGAEADRAAEDGRVARRDERTAEIDVEVLVEGANLDERFQSSNHMGPSECPHFAVRSPRTATDENHGIDRLARLAFRMRGKRGLLE